MEKTANLKNWKAWGLATRPKTLTVSVFAVVAGSALARTIDPILMIATLLSAFFIQIGTNLVNDALDFKKGADTQCRLGPQRMTASGLLSSRQVLMGGLVCFLLAIFTGIPLILAGGQPIFGLLVLSCLMGYLYTGGPYPLAYNGLGDIFSFLFFGLALTGVSYFLQTGDLDLNMLIAGTQLGALTTLLLVINNLRDVSEDTKSQKRTLVVRFGETFARCEITLFCFLPYFLCFFWLLNGWKRAAFLPFCSFPLMSNLLTKIWNTKPGRVYNDFLTQAALLHVLFATLLSLGFYFR